MPFSTATFPSSLGLCKILSTPFWTLQLLALNLRIALQTVQHTKKYRSNAPIGIYVKWGGMYVGRTGEFGPFPKAEQSNTSQQSKALAPKGRMREIGTLSLL